MDRINKYQTVVILLAIVLGLLLGHIDVLKEYASVFIVPLLMVMLFGLFLSMDLGDLMRSFLQVRFSLANIVINFLWTPLLAYALGYLFLMQDLPIWIGFVMLMVTPCTDWYLVFTGGAKGNVPLSTSILPVNLVLQVVLLPVYLLVFFGQSGNVELGVLVESMLLVLVLPFVVAWFVKLYHKKIATKYTAVIRFFEQSQVLFLALAVVAMFASEGRSLVENPHVIYKLLLPVLVFFTVTFGLGLLVSRLLGLNYADKVSLVMTTMARNSPVALAIAVSAFSSEPMIALALVIGPLIELPVLVLVAQILLRQQKGRCRPGN